MLMSQFETSSISMINIKKHEETVDCKTAHKKSRRLTKMLRSTAATSVLELDQTPSITICLANISGSDQLKIFLKISLALQRSLDITMHNGTQIQTHTHTYMQTRRQHTEHHVITVR